MGLSKLGSQDLTEAQYQMLAKYYESSSSSDKVCWKQFHDDIENGRLHKELVISCTQTSALMKNQLLSDFEIQLKHYENKYMYVPTTR